MRASTCASLTALFCVLPAIPASAALIAADSFNAQPGAALQGQGGGTGFSSPWMPGAFNASITNNYTTNAGSLSYPGLATSNGSVSATATNAISGLTRTLSTPLGTVGTTDYFSILLRPDGPVTGGTFNNFFGLYLNASNGNDQFFGKPGNGPTGFYDLEDRGGTDQYNTGTMAVTGQTALLVLRIDFLASGINRETLYVNPTVGAPEPYLGAVKQDEPIGLITGVTLYSTGAFTADEIRIGTTFADVVPAATVPEPSSLGLCVIFGAAGLGVARIRRHRLNA